MVINSAPPFSFGAVVIWQRGTADGEIIKLVDPVYTQLMEEIKRNPQIIYQIDWRKWENGKKSLRQHTTKLDSTK
jgi:hypothetical protein